MRGIRSINLSESRKKISSSALVVFLHFFILLILLQFKSFALPDSIILSLILTCILVYLWSLKSRTKLLSYTLILFIFLGYSSTLINIDRSRSFYVLGWVYNHKIEIVNNEIDLSSVKSSEKINVQAINQRVNEHIKRKIIRMEDSRLVLTNLGVVIVKLSNITSYIFNLEGWANNSK
jgi:hypothetical protein